MAVICLVSSRFQAMRPMGPLISGWRHSATSWVVIEPATLPLAATVGAPATGHRAIHG